MLITDTPVDTFDQVSLDTVGKLPATPDGNKHILTMQDNLSKYCIAVPIPDYYRCWAAGRVFSVLGLIYSSRRDPARLQNAL